MLLLWKRGHYTSECRNRTKDRNVDDRNGNLNSRNAMVIQILEDFGSG